MSSISATTNQEQVAFGDVDGDTDVDIHLGSQWLRQETNGSFTTQTGVAVSGGDPDRVVLADIDGDDDLDVVIGVEFAQRLVWGENDNSGQTWTERVIATDVDYFSVDAADVDRDGDIDVVGGAHQGNGEVFLYENNGQGGSWITHTVDPGDSALIDHHDGTQLVDMDLDGDLDIISIGWSKRSLVIYENLAIGGGNVDLTPPGHRIGGRSRRPHSGDRRIQRRLWIRHRRGLFQLRDLGRGQCHGTPLSIPPGKTVTLTTSTLSEGTIYHADGQRRRGSGGQPHRARLADSLCLCPGSGKGSPAYWPLNEGPARQPWTPRATATSGTLVNGPQWIDGP